ncbi:MAG: hypothetical protein WKG00_21180 [Polyangiaceae bacterium]
MKPTGAMELFAWLPVPMTMAAPYRHDRDALESRLTSVEDELRELQRRKAELAAATASEEKLEGEADELRKRLLRDRRALPLLDAVRVASPCPASWDAMKGDERVRFCGQCDKNVYDLSSMTRDEASTFVREHEDKGVCIRMHRRADGRLMTSDCPVGAKRKRNRRRLAGIMVGAGVVGGGALWAATPTMGDMQRPVGQMTMGDMEVVAGKMELAEPPPPPANPAQAGPSATPRSR